MYESEPWDEYECLIKGIKETYQEYETGIIDIDEFLDYIEELIKQD